MTDLAPPGVAEQPGDAGSRDRPGPGWRGRVTVEDLTWRPIGRRRPILDRVSLSIRPGERVLLVGSSGAGKSTLLRALAGLLLTADSGELTGAVRIGGVDPGSQPGLAGLVLQEPGSATVSSTVHGDVAFGLENVGMARAAMRRHVAEALAAVGLDLPLEAPTGTLSGGELQRLALAGALAMSPQVLLLDEPTAMLDAASAHVVREAVDRVVRSRGLTLVVVEHQLGPWLPLADRLVVLGRHGQIIADGAPRAVLAERGSDLAEEGVWVPGYPPPAPLDLDPGPVAVPVPVPKSGKVRPSTPHDRTLPDLETDLDRGGGVNGAPVMTARALTIRHRSPQLTGPGRVTTAVEGLDLTARAGASVALVGPSGSGKSSVLAAFAGLLRPEAGEVLACDRLSPRQPSRAQPGPAQPSLSPLTPHPHEWSSREVAARIAWVPQDASATVLARTVMDELLVTSRALGLPERRQHDRAKQLLTHLGLADRAESDPRHLSGGEQRRVAVASALLHEPGLVLADEPTVSQDRTTWAAVVGLLAAAQAGGAAVVVSTHDEALVGRSDETVRLTAPPPVGRAVEQQRRPLVARAGPLSLFLATLLMLPLPALIGSWRQAVAVLAVQGLLTAVALWAPGPGRPPSGRARALLGRLAPMLVGCLGVGWSVWLLGGHDLERAVTALLRVLAFVYPAAVVLPYVDAEELSAHLAQRVRVPARVAVSAAAALSRFQSFGELWAQRAAARRVRGVGHGDGVLGRARAVLSITMGVLVGAVVSATTLAVAMDARGFAAAHHRTWYSPARWRVADAVTVCAALLVVATAAVVNVTVA